MARILKDFICSKCGNVQEEFESEHKDIPCNKCGEKTLQVDPVPRSNFIDKTREYNWTVGKTIQQQAAVINGQMKPY